MKNTKNTTTVKATENKTTKTQETKMKNTTAKANAVISNAIGGEVRTTKMGKKILSPKATEKAVDKAVAIEKAVDLNKVDCGMCKVKADCPTAKYNEPCEMYVGPKKAKAVKAVVEVKVPETTKNTGIKNAVKTEKAPKVKTEKATAKAEASRVRNAVCQLIVERKLTDAQIMEKTGATALTVAKMYRRLNKGNRKGFEMPKTPYVRLTAAPVEVKVVSPKVPKTTKNTGIANAVKSGKAKK